MKKRFDLKSLMKSHVQGTKRARLCLVTVPLVMIIVMITRPIYAPFIDVFGEDSDDAVEEAGDVNPVRTTAAPAAMDDALLAIFLPAPRCDDVDAWTSASSFATRDTPTADPPIGRHRTPARSRPAESHGGWPPT